MISKTVSILELGHTSGDDVVFSNWNAIVEDEGDIRGGRTISIRKELWLELGSPETITVTVESGDTLNGSSLVPGSLQLGGKR